MNGRKKINKAQALIFLARFVVIQLFVCVIIVFTITTHMILMVPIERHFESKCIEAGYPQAYVTYDFKAYCINLDGSVTAKVIPIEKLE